MRIRILLVDDSPETLEALHLQYSLHRDVEVIGMAKSAAEAMAYLEAVDIDLLSIDIQLGYDSGFNLCSQVHLRYPDAFITMCSVEDSESYRKKASDSGAGYFLPKPVCQDDIRNLITFYKEIQDSKLQQEHMVSEDSNWIDNLLCQSKIFEVPE